MNNIPNYKIYIILIILFVLLFLFTEKPQYTTITQKLHIPQIPPIQAIDTPIVTENDKVDVKKQIAYFMKKDRKINYVDNDLISGQLELYPASYTDPENNSIVKLYKSYNTDTHTPNQKNTINNQNKLKFPKEFHKFKFSCQEEAIKRCNLAPINSTRCFLNECELSTYNQCTNNVHTQNSCECQANDLCQLPDNVKSKCYKEQLKECL